jgi:glycine hydroxymethyltransferase
LPIEVPITSDEIRNASKILSEYKNSKLNLEKRIVENAKTLADALIAKGFKLVSGGTDNHLMLVDLIDTGITGKELEHRLDEVHITLNKNAIPNDPQSPFITSGVRIGTPAVTSRGFGKEEMLKIADYIYDVTFNFEESKERVKNEVIALCEKFPIYN